MMQVRFSFRRLLFCLPPRFFFNPSHSTLFQCFFSRSGDTLKLNFPLGGTVSFLSWGLVDYKNEYDNVGYLSSSRDILRPAVEYLANSYTGNRTYVGQISQPSVDHQFWGRAQPISNRLIATCSLHLESKYDHPGRLARLCCRCPCFCFNGV
ncbi:MAG: glycoside hydrolase family 9 protein [Taibaiella sp.]|nr:glycoside hydrolase family 9 protein [Taibaiella sp.]